VLPVDPSEFAEASVAPFGSEWLPRYQALLDAATSLSVCGAMSRAGIALAEYRAMGMAAKRANLLETRAIALRIEPGERPALGDPWLQSGRQLVHVPVSETAVHRPTTLPDGQLLWLLMLGGDANLAEPLGFGSVAELIDALPGEGATAAIDLRVDGERHGLPALLRNATPGTILASTAAAMALLAEDRAARAEPLGEMETTDGATGVYAIALKGSG
jgi:hypothetical protein